MTLTVLNWNAASKPPWLAPAAKHIARAASPAAAAQSLANWLLWANPAQTPPPGAWRVWVMLGGRGGGKTRAGAEWVRREVHAGRRRRIALVGTDFHHVREVMLEGESGLLTLMGAEAPTLEVTRRRVVFANGAQAQFFSAEDPNGLRGPQFDAAWCDEFANWPKAEQTLSTLRLALRLGDAPRLVITTTPQPLPALKALLKEPGVALTRAPTAENAENLAPGFVEAMRAIWGATPFARQEIEGQLLDERPGALWTADLLARARTGPMPDRVENVIIAVDPPASIGPNADACGIIAVGVTGEGVGVVLADATTQGAEPRKWAKAAAELAKRFNARAIVAEANNGGEMVRTILADAVGATPVRLVRARLDKLRRALPIAALYAQGRVRHAAGLEALEEEMSVFGTDAQRGSPDRVDALVWGLTTALLEAPAPRLRPL